MVNGLWPRIDTHLSWRGRRYPAGIRIPAGVIRHWSLLEITAQLGIRSAQVAVGVHGVDISIDVDILISRDGLASHQSSPLPLPTPSPSLLPPPSPSLFAPPSPPPSRTAVGSRMHRLTDRRLSVDCGLTSIRGATGSRMGDLTALAWVISQAMVSWLWPCGRCSRCSHAALMLTYGRLSVDCGLTSTRGATDSCMGDPTGCGQLVVALR